MCVCVCVHATDLGRAECASPSLPSPSQMKDDGSSTAKKQRRIFTGASYENKCTNNRHTEAVTYDTATLLGTFPVTKSML